jgi:two-component system, NarL family, nitrate/nitrite response regulator NarL
MSNLLQVTTILGCKNSMLREGLRHILSSTRYKVHPDDLTSRFASGLSSYGSPCLFVIDSNLYPGEIKDIVEDVKKQHPDGHVVILADGFDFDELKSVLQAGADGYCLATTGCDALVKYLDLVMLGEIVFPSSALLSAMTMSGEVREIRTDISPITIPGPQPERSGESKESVIRTLSIREAEILQCLMQGAPNKVIARKLDVAEATVKVHIKAILRKIRVANRTQAAMWAVNHLSSQGSDTAWIPTAEGMPPQSASLMKVL